VSDLPKSTKTQTDDDFSYVISYAESLVIGTDYGHDTSSELNAISRFQAMEELDQQAKWKILSEIPDDSTGFEAS
jgi:hypothetical protein